MSRQRIRFVAAHALIAIGCSSASDPSSGPGDDDAGSPSVAKHDAGSSEADSGTSSPSPDGGGVSGDSGARSGDSGASSGDSGGTPKPDAGAHGLSPCGAALDTTAPTAASIVKDGPYSVTSYSTGLPSSTAYKSLTVYYPSNAAGPHVVVMISPGLTEVLAYLTPWAQRFASYGYVAVFVEANDTNADSEATRADGLWAAIASIKGENTRAGGPLQGKLSDCLVTSGHSLGGGASFTIANSHPNDVTAALGFNPYDPTTKLSSIVAPTLVLTGQNDPTAPPAQHGKRQYDSMSTSISKEYVEIAGGNHQAALTPATIPGQYAVSWIKLTVDGDARYRPFLDQAASGISAFATTLSP